MKLSLTKYILFISIGLLAIACSEIDEGKRDSKIKPELKDECPSSNKLTTLNFRKTAVTFDNYSNIDETEAIYQTTFKERTARQIHNNLLGLSQKNTILISDENRAISTQKNFSDIPHLREKSNWAIRVIFDNDIWNNTDYYYTNGLNIQLVTPIAKSSPTNKILLGTKNSGVEINGFSIRQNMYTPTNPDVTEILNQDRPFAAFLCIGHFRETYDLKKKIHFNSRLEIGVLGPASLGGTIQSSLHEEEPVGWQNQIQNSFVINYQTQFEKGLIQLPNFELNASAKASIGTLFNQLGGGFYMRFGRFFPFYRGPLNLSKGTDKKSPLQIWFFTQGNANVVLFDATLQGGLFNTENPYTIQSNAMNNIVYQASAGIAVYSGSLGLELENFFLSPEFAGARNFGWGRIKLIASF